MERLTKIWSFRERVFFFRIWELSDAANVAKFEAPRGAFSARRNAGISAGKHLYGPAVWGSASIDGGGGTAVVARMSGSDIG